MPAGWLLLRPPVDRRWLAARAARGLGRRRPPRAWPQLDGNDVDSEVGEVCVPITLAGHGGVISEPGWVAWRVRTHAKYGELWRGRLMATASLPHLGGVVMRTVLSGERPALQVVHFPDGDWGLLTESAIRMSRGPVSSAISVMSLIATPAWRSWHRWHLAWWRSARRPVSRGSCPHLPGPIRSAVPGSAVGRSPHGSGRHAAPRVA